MTADDLGMEAYAVALFVEKVGCLSLMPPGGACRADARALIGQIETTLGGAVCRTQLVETVEMILSSLDELADVGIDPAATLELLASLLSAWDLLVALGAALRLARAGTEMAELVGTRADRAAEPVPQLRQAVSALVSAPLAPPLLLRPSTDLRETPAAA